MAENGDQLGIVAVGDALRMAEEQNVDLVEIAPLAVPPVCKLMDFGKYKYEAAMKERESRRNQSHTVIKEMKLRPKIDSHDYETKKGHVERFLRAGARVKITVDTNVLVRAAVQDDAEQAALAARTLRQH